MAASIQLLSLPRLLSPARQRPPVRYPLRSAKRAEQENGMKRVKKISEKFEKFEKSIKGRKA